MTPVFILVPQYCTVLNCIERVFNIFVHANDCVSGKGGQPLFELHLVGMINRVQLYGGYSVKPDLLYGDVSDTGLIIIPSLAGDIAGGIKDNATFIPWIKEQYLKGSVVAGMCTGSFLLKGTGLVGTGDCKINWFADPVFRKQYSQINDVAEKIITDETAIHGRWGAYSFINMFLENVAGDEAAAACALIFKEEFNRECQSVISIGNKKKNKEIIGYSRAPACKIRVR